MAHFIIRNGHKISTKCRLNHLLNWISIFVVSNFTSHSHSLVLLFQSSRVEILLSPANVLIFLWQKEIIPLLSTCFSQCQLTQNANIFSFCSFRCLSTSSQRRQMSWEREFSFLLTIIKNTCSYTHGSSSWRWRFFKNVIDILTEASSYDEMMNSWTCLYTFAYMSLLFSRWRL